MFHMFLTLTATFIKLFFIPAYFLFAIGFVFYVAYAIYYKLECRRLGIKPKPYVRKVKEPGFFEKLFLIAPRQMALDRINRPPDFFVPQGLIVFTGRQGAGKTIGMVQYARTLQKMYPKCKCITNLNYKYENDRLEHWMNLVNYKNDKKGVVVIMDELQNWFSSNQSRSFPPEMLSVVTQNRKNRRIILATSQSFHLLAKSLRSQATEVRDCHTFFGCITVIRRREPVLDSEGNVAEWKYRGMYFFVHDPALRDSYDTYAVVESLSSSGFSKNEFLDTSDTYINMPRGKGRKKPKGA